MFNWFKKLINNKMDVNQIADIRASLTKYNSFQWIKGDKVGMVTSLKDVVDDNGIVFVEFTDGSRCNMSLFSEYILKIGAGDSAVDFADNKAIKAAIEQSAGNTAGATNGVVGQSRLNVPVVKLSPIQELLKKRKPNNITINIELTLNVPPIELLDVLKDSFDHAEDEVVEFVLNSISQDDIKKSVRQALQEFYQLVEENK